MGKASYIFDDYVKNSGVTLTLTSTDANYPVANCQNEQIALTTRTTAKVNILLQIDLGAALGSKALQAFFCGNHNFSGGDIKVYSYSDAGFSLNQTLIATISYRQFDAYARVSSAPTARRYWEFDFTKNGTVASASSYLEFGRAMAYLDLVQLTDIEDPVVLRGYQFRNITNYTKYGVKCAVYKLSKQQERFRLRWGERARTNFSEFRTLYDAVYGDAHPFVFIPDISGAACHYGYLEEPELSWAEKFGTGTGAHIQSVDVGFLEAVRGKS